MPRTYEQTLATLYALEAKKGMDFRLSRLDPVLDRLGHPEKSFACVHVAGTNGKGSTSAMIDAALRAGGHRTGLYTSPHLVSFRERIRTNGEPISREAVVRHAATVLDADDDRGAGLTFFEIVTLAAFLELREREVEIAVIEVGLGGRLDVTNVVHGDVAVITSIAIDHAAFLGDTLAEIAFEKVGILEPGAVLVTGALPDEAMEVVESRAADLGARHLAFGRDFGEMSQMRSAQRGGEAMAGLHQARNAAVAAAAVRALGPRFGVDPRVRDRAIVSARWPGRLELTRRRRGDGPLVLDAAHNPEAARALAASLDEVAPSRPRVLVFAAMADKDWPAMLAALAPAFDSVVFAPLPMSRAEDPHRFLEAVPGGVVAQDAEAALELAEALASAHGSIVVSGSIFLLGHLYRIAGGTLLEDDLVD